MVFGLLGVDGGEVGHTDTLAGHIHMIPSTCTGGYQLSRHDKGEVIKAVDAIVLEISDSCDTAIHH